MALLGRYTGPFAVANPRVGAECSRFAAQRQLGGLLAGHAPGMKQIEVGVVLCNVLRIRQSCGRVFCRETCNVIGRLHRALDGRLRKIRGARIAAALPQVHRDAE